MHEGMERSGTACKFTTFSYSYHKKRHKSLTNLRLRLATLAHPILADAKLGGALDPIHARAPGCARPRRSRQGFRGSRFFG